MFPHMDDSPDLTVTILVRCCFKGICVEDHHLHSKACLTILISETEQSFSQFFLERQALIPPDSHPMCCIPFLACTERHEPPEKRPPTESYLPCHHFSKENIWNFLYETGSRAAPNQIMQIVHHRLLARVIIQAP